MSRRLVSIVREVPERRRTEYDRLWYTLRDASVASGAHAWRFAAESSPGRFIEFLEFGAGGDPTEAPAARDSLAALDAAFPGDAERWAGIDT
jgi:hypothetical protein